MPDSSTRPMRQLVASINFHPDHAGIAVYSTDLARYLSSCGHRVSVVTGFPYYPQWVKRNEDRGRLSRRETIDGATVFRGYLYVPHRPSLLRRILHDATFSLFAAWGFIRAGRQDLIIVLVPPLPLSLVALLFARLWSARFVVHIQDLQLDAAVNLGMMKGRGLAGLLRRIERGVYRRADLVVPISEGMARLVEDKGVDRERMQVVYNWVDIKTASRPVLRGAFRRRHRLDPNEFLLAYAGNLGIKQGIDVLLDVAARIPPETGIRILVIGDGADRNRLVLRAREQDLQRVMFLPLLPETEYLEMLDDVDLLFVGQRPGADEVFFPSKLLGILARGRPVVVAADAASELARFVTNSGCGGVVPWGDGGALLSEILGTRGTPELLRKRGEEGRRAVAAFDRTAVLDRFAERLASLTSQLNNPR